jgi:hypothetical protein
MWQFACREARINAPFVAGMGIVFSTVVYMTSQLTEEDAKRSSFVNPGGIPHK